MHVIANNCAGPRRQLRVRLAAIDAAATPEMFAIDLHEAQHAIEELLGGGDEEAVRDAIFSQFCIGK